MREYIIRRLLLLVPIMIGVSFLTFATFRIIPGDAALLIWTVTRLAGFATPKARRRAAEKRRDLGL